MPTSRTASPPPQASNWNRSASSNDSTTPSEDVPTLAERRNVTATPSIRLSASKKIEKKEEEEEETEFSSQRLRSFSSSSSAISLEPPSPRSPVGLLLFRRRSSTNLAAQAAEHSNSKLPIHPLDSPSSSSSSRRLSDGSSSAVNPSISGSIRGSWSSGFVEDNSIPTRQSSQLLPPPSSSATYALSSSTSTQHYVPHQLSPIEASPLIPFSPNSTPSTTPGSSVELVSTPSFSSSSSPLSTSDRSSSKIEPFLYVQGSSPPRRQSFSVVELELDSSRPSTIPLLRSQKPRSKRSNPTVAQEEQEFEDQGLQVDSFEVSEEIKKFREEQLWGPSDVKLRTLVVEPKEGAEHEATIIMLHGLSQTVEDDSWLHYELSSQLPSVRWVMPQAPKMPVTYHDGALKPAWFDIASFPWNARSESGEAGEDETHYFSSTRAINAVIREERDRIIAAERLRQGRGMEEETTEDEREAASRRILLGGFSQGGVMALLAGLTNEDKLGGVMVFSGMLPVRRLLPELVRDLDRTDLPIFWGHGEVDPYLLVDDATSSVKALREPYPGLALSRVTYRTYPPQPHTWSREEVDDLSDWMKRNLDTPLKPVGTKSHGSTRFRRRR
ncbi:alpha/beta hydrolase [Sporobolomyces salmoneus]|uniref:alpha/beta hydrolase n=1 Tax=Sporobolomyces salmoneus TaxID=183962 RepID=UPI003177478C